MKALGIVSIILIVCALICGLWMKTHPQGYDVNFHIWLPIAALVSALVTIVLFLLKWYTDPAGTHIRHPVNRKGGEKATHEGQIRHGDFFGHLCYTVGKRRGCCHEKTSAAGG